MKTNHISKAAACVLFCLCQMAQAQMTLLPEPGILPLTGKLERRHKAENKFYAKVYGYYAPLSPGGFSGQGVDPVDIYTIAPGRAYTFKSSGYEAENPFGVGLRVGGGIGMVVNDFINVGIDGEYLLVSALAESYQITITDYNTAAFNQSRQIKRVYTYRTVNVIPNITFKAVSKSEYYIYNRIGIVIGIPTQLSYRTTSTYEYSWAPDFGENIRNAYNMDKSPGLGYQTALGIQFRLSGNIRGFAEAVLSSFQFQSNGATMTEYKYSNAQESSRDLPADDETRRVEAQNLKIPVSSFGIGVGLAFRF